MKLLALAALLLPLTGCAQYATPGRAADMSLFGGPAGQRDAATDPSIRRQLRLQPLADLPTRLAVAHVQAPGYSSYSCSSYGDLGGRYSVVGARTVEKDDDFTRLSRLALVDGVAPITPLLLPGRLDSDEAVRGAAARLGADMLLVYTFDTRFSKDDLAPPLGLVTLGLFPTISVTVQSTASAVLVDTRNGFVYAVAEGSSDTGQPANGWTSQAAVDQSRIRAERQALDKLLVDFERAWGQVVTQLTIRARSQPLAPQTPVSAAIPASPDTLAPSGVWYRTDR